MIYPTVYLYRSEVAVARLIVDRIQKIHNEAGTSIREWTNNPVLSMIGELAAAKYLNVYPRSLGVIENGSPSVIDLVYKGYGIDVKTCDPGKNLLVRDLHKELFYILVFSTIIVSEMATCQIVGYVNGGDISAVGKWTNPGLGPCWLVESQRLLPITDFLDRVNNSERTFVCKNNGF